MTDHEALDDEGFGVQRALEAIMWVEDESHAAGHAGAEVVAHGAQEHGRAAGHVFAAVGSAALDHGGRTTVAHREALARLASREQLAAGRPIKAGVADDRVALRRDQVRRRFDDDGRAGQTLADIVVRLAGQLDAQALHGEGAERLAGRAAQPHRHGIGLDWWWNAWCYGRRADFDRHIDQHPDQH